jgi:hypothetical protein
LRLQRVGQGSYFTFFFVMSAEPWDPALCSLLADLTVSRASRELGRVPGVLGDLLPVPTSKNFTLLNEGASHNSPRLGQPRNVNSLEIEPAPRGMPRSISVLSPTASSGETRRYQILRVPMDIDTFGTFCFTTIGQGPCMCFAKNCGTSH